MLKLVPGTLLVTSLGLVSVLTGTQPASAFPSLQLPISRPAAAPSPAVPTLSQPAVSPSPAVPTLPLSITSPSPAVPTLSQPAASPSPAVPTLSQPAAAPSPSPTVPTLPLASASTSLPQTSTTAKATANVVASLEKVEAKVTESTNSTVGNLAGASTDSRTGVGLNLLTNSTEVKNSVDQLITNPLSGSGGAAVAVAGNKNGINGDAGIDLTLQVGDLASVQICLDGDASIGSAGDGSLADCQTEKPKPQAVPEPTTIGALALLGAYLVIRRRPTKASLIA